MNKEGRQKNIILTQAQIDVIFIRPREHEMNT
jgi:hypothetical protein